VVSVGEDSYFEGTTQTVMTFERYGEDNEHTDNPLQALVHVVKDSEP
jgi:hypothetical protein